MKQVKVGIIGTGFIGAAHVEALRRLGYVEVAALAEADRKLARAKAEQFHIPRAYGDYRELLADPEITVVHNCTPNYLHYETSRAIMAAGKQVVSEKPLAMNSKESRSLVQLARRAGVVNAIDFNYRYYPLAQQIRAMRANKELGDLYTVHGSYLQDWLYYKTDYNWRLEPEVGGISRAVADIGSHWCDLIQYLTGLKIVEVMADLGTVHPFRLKPKKAIETFANKELKPSDYQKMPIPTEDFGHVLIRFENGMKGSFLVSQVSAGRKNRLYLEIDGSEKSVVWDQEKPEELWIGYRNQPNQMMVKDSSLMYPAAKPYASYPAGHPEGYPDGLKNFFTRVYSYILAGKNPLKDKPDFSTFEDGHNEIALVEAVLASNKKRGWSKVKY